MALDVEIEKYGGNEWSESKESARSVNEREKCLAQRPMDLAETE